VAGQFAARDIAAEQQAAVYDQHLAGEAARLVEQRLDAAFEPVTGSPLSRLTRTEDGTAPSIAIDRRAVARRVGAGSCGEPAPSLTDAARRHGASPADAGGLD
jgi:hypothetical protein